MPEYQAKENIARKKRYIVKNTWNNIYKYFDCICIRDITSRNIIRFCKCSNRYYVLWTRFLSLYLFTNIVLIIKENASANTMNSATVTQLARISAQKVF